MPQYETVCVVKPDIQGESLNKITDKIQKVLTDFDVETVNKQDWGIRKLAYPIEKYKTGHYLYFVYEGGGGLVSELERQLNYEDGVMRYMTMKLTKQSRTDVKPEPFQFARIEPESYSHPFGGGPGERRERRERRPQRSERGE